MHLQYTHQVICRIKIERDAKSQLFCHQLMKFMQGISCQVLVSRASCCDQIKVNSQGGFAAVTTHLLSAQHLWLLTETSLLFSFKPFFTTLKPLIGFCSGLSLKRHAGRTAGDGENSLAHGIKVGGWGNRGRLRGGAERHGRKRRQKRLKVDNG